MCVSTVVLTSASVGISTLNGHPIDAADLATFAAVRMETSVAVLLDNALLSFTLLHTIHTANMELIAMQRIIHWETISKWQL